MIYFLCDTNIWIYQPNSQNPLSKNKDEGHTEKLYRDITKLMHDSKIKIIKTCIMVYLSVCRKFNS